MQLDSDKRRVSLYFYLIAWVYKKKSEFDQFATDFAAWSYIATDGYNTKINNKKAHQLFIDYLRQHGTSTRTGVQRDYLYNCYALTEDIPCIPFEPFNERLFYGKLDTDDRNALKLHYQFGYDLKEVGTMFNIGESAACQKITRAKQKLARRHGIEKYS